MSTQEQQDNYFMLSLPFETREALQDFVRSSLFSSARDAGHSGALSVEELVVLGQLEDFLAAATVLVANLSVTIAKYGTEDDIGFLLRAVGKGVTEGRNIRDER